MRLDILNINGQATGRTVELPSDIFEIAPNEHVIYLSVKEYMANQRQGTHDSKERNEVWRTTKKFKKQKGTGGARAGSLKNPMFKGGGRAFGPHPREYNIKLNKKVKVLARKSALSQMAASNSIVVIEDLTFNTPKTKQFSDVLKGLKLDNKKSVFVTPEYNSMVYLSGRNLPKTSIRVAKDLSTYEILNSSTLVLTESSIEKIKNTLS